MKTIQRSILGAVLATALAAPAAAMIVNGGFESGFSGWTRVDQLGSDGGFLLQTAPASPVNGFVVPAPPEGLAAAMSDQQAGGSHVLYQDFVVPTGLTGGTISFALFLNSGDDYRNPASLDWAGAALNQQARVDILLPGADAFSVNPADVLLNLFGTSPGDALVSGYDNFAVNISALLVARQGQTLRLRFAEVDNVSFLNFGVDQVSIDPAVVLVPEPASWLLVAAALGGAALRRRREADTRPGKRPFQLKRLRSR